MKINQKCRRKYRNFYHPDKTYRNILNLLNRISIQKKYTQQYQKITHQSPRTHVAGNVTARNKLHDLAPSSVTRKVICDHSTVGIVVTTDGSVTEIPRRTIWRPRSG